MQELIKKKAMLDRKSSLYDIYVQIDGDVASGTKIADGNYAFFKTLDAVFCNEKGRVNSAASRD